MKLIFMTFGSHNEYIDAANRLVIQARSFKLFSEFFLYTGNYLMTDPFFWNQHGEFVTKNKRGCGYWIWKSYLLKKKMGELQDGDVIMYLDSGCELDIQEKTYLLHYIEQVKQDKLICCDTECKEQEWTKQDLIYLLNMNYDSCLQSSQREAGALLFYVCPETRSFVNQWYDLCCSYNNIDDTPSILPNNEMFKEHRHDQSIFSLLTKKYNFNSSNNLKKKCIKYIRNRTKFSFLKYTRLLEKHAKDQPV
jgi:hypothetical protein